MRSDDPDPALEVPRPKRCLAPRDLNTRSGIMKEERREDRGVAREGEMGKGAVPAAAGAVARVWVVGIEGACMIIVARRATIMRLAGIK